MIKRVILLFFLLFSFVEVFPQEINEICPSNISNYESGEGVFPDWVELTNTSSAAINLEGFSFSDEFDHPTKWIFPGISILPGEFKVISFNTDSVALDIVNFELSKKGGSLYLFDDTGIFIDSVAHPRLELNHSYGKFGDSWFYFEEPTPTLSNEISVGFKGYCATPVIPRFSGKQISGELVTIQSQEEGSQIFYSLNGTSPVGAHLYTDPIRLDKTISLKVIAVKDSLIASPPIYRTFFINSPHELPIVNINVDSLELLDELEGIYVLGPDASEEFPYFGANFWKDIEIQAFYEYFDEEEALREALNCGMKIHGGTISSTRPMKSLRLIARDRYEENSFTHPYFPNKENNEFKRLLLRNSGSDFNITHLKDGIFHQFILDHGLDVDVQAYQPVVVYINGAYWGVHNMREKLDKHYIQSNYGIDPETVNLLEEEELILISGDSVDFTTLRDYVLENDLSEQLIFDSVAQRLDTKSMVDYFIMELFVNNRDWPYNNLKLWNSSDSPQWRYLYSDIDAGAKYYGSEPIDFNSLDYILGPFGDNNVHVVIFKKLLENDEFKRYFINRYSDLMNTVLQHDYLLDYIYKAKEKLNPEMKLHFIKWWGDVENWNTNFLTYDSFFEDRVSIVRNDLSLVFEKDSAIEIYVGMYPANAGGITLNTITLNEFPFTGKYYTTNKIDLSVSSEIEAPFLYWENITTGERYSTSTIQIDPIQADSLIAVFDLPISFNLNIYPVPVEEFTTVNFSLPESGNIAIEIVGIDGQRVVKNELGYLAKGTHTINMDYSRLEFGVYLISLTLNNRTETIRFVKS